jgi:hypothetical protein
MMRPASIRRGAWLALFGLIFQIALSVAHSAAHFDHLVGCLVHAGVPLATTGLQREPASPSPVGPVRPDQDQCPLDLGLLLSGTFVLVAPGSVLAPLTGNLPPLDVAHPAFGLAVRRHLLPLARAPPLTEILA